MELKNKTIFFLGSSVTYGQASNGVSFADIIKEECGINMIKEAVSGTTIADINEKSYVARLKKAEIPEKVDLFVCQLSTNDATKNADKTETEKGIRFIIEYAKKHFKCPIVFYTSTYFDNDNYKELVLKLESMQAEYDFKILNLYKDEEMTAVSKEDYTKYMADRLHPTIVGYREWWTPKFIEFFKSL